MKCRTILWVLVAVFAVAFAHGDETTHPTGYLPMPYRPKITRHVSAVSGKKLLSGTSSSLPSKWDSRDSDSGWVTPVKDQSPWGTCWAFAACAVLETQLLRTGRGTYDLSEKNLANLHGFATGYNLGGTQDMASAYFLRWSGAVAESNDVYQTTSKEWEANPSLPMPPVVHVQDVVWVPYRTSCTDNDSLKEAITNYGAVAVSYYHADNFGNDSNGAYYCNLYTNAENAVYGNHAVTVVGWDDDYPATNFSEACPPPGDGAWLVKNSWGTDKYDEGYLHISYYDATFACYDGCFVYIPATNNWTAVYGYDRLGAAFDYTNLDDLKFEAAVFQSAWNEEVAAVGVFSSIDGNPYTISIYTNVTFGASSPTEGGRLATSQSGTLSHAGYTTITLESPVHLTDRSAFAVIYEQKGSDTSHLICHDCIAEVEKKYVDWILCSPITNTTFYGYTEKKGRTTVTNWTDAVKLFSDAEAIVCLKAYTRATVEAKAGDAPAENDDGTSILVDLESTNKTAYAAYGGSFGAFANLVGANGRSLYSSWLAGFDPANPDDGELKLEITLTNNVPYLTWSPNLGSTERKYTILGSDTLASPDWQEVTDLETTSAKYFKVIVTP